VETKEYRERISGAMLACSVDYAYPGDAPSALFLHGAGPSNREHAAYLSAVFAEAGRSVVRFDYPGHGESSGTIEGSSLERRHDEARAVIKRFGMDAGSLCLVGTSMGGYIAASLVKDYAVDALVLFCLAAYDRIAWSVPFGPAFSAILRRDLSCLESDVDERLGAFAGRSLIALAGRDEVIPEKVVGMYQSVLGKNAGHSTLILEESPHPIHRWAADKPEARERIKAALRGALWPQEEGGE
jgi:hypothetical protein